MTRFILFISIVLITFLSPAHAITGDMFESNALYEEKGFRHSILRQDAWNAMAAKPESFTTSHTEIVKFVIDTEKGWLPYFQNTNLWSIHYFFVRDRIEPEYPHALFNEKEYRSPERRFVMGSIVYYSDSNQWAFEIVPGDTMDAQTLERAFKTIKQAFLFGDRLRFRPQSLLHEQLVKGLKGAVPVWNMQDFQKTIRYQPLTLGTSYGYLRFVDGEPDPASVTPDQILITGEVPDDLPVCAGLITSKLQASLAHIALLLEGRQTPNMALRDAVNNQKLRKYEGKLVRLDITAQDYKITLAEQSNAEKYWASLRPKNTFYPKFDPKNLGLPDLNDLRLSDLGAIGGKAAHLAAIANIRPPIKTPGGFVVPLYYYLNHLNKNGIDDLIKTSLANIEDTTLLAKRLNGIQRIIKTMPVSTKLLASIRKKINRFNNEKLILRSSTNAEDIQGFTGAGLYTSKIIKKNATDTELADALRTVWASVWNLRAYQERDWYRISHEQVGMAVLIQPFVQNLVANGVAITANPFFQARPGYLINIQTMNGSVTGAKDGTLPETLLVYNYAQELETHILSTSSLNNGKRILLKNDIPYAMDIFKDIHNYFIPEAEDDSGKAMDIEFLLTKDRRIVIVQARPHQVRFRVLDKAEDFDPK